MTLTQIAECRKALAAAVTIMLLLVKQFYGWSLPGIEGPTVDLIMSAIIGAVGLWSVWFVPNQKPA